MNIKKKVINGLFGLAVADSIGNPWKFKKSINPSKVLDFANKTKTLVISDDTQMTLFGFSSMLPFVDISFSDKIHRAYTDWYKTQAESYHNVNKSLNPLLEFSSLYSIQSPGMTCMYSLHQLSCGRTAANDSYGCGSVMRLLPFLLVLEINSLEKCIEIAKISGRVTHHAKENDLAIEKYIRVCHDIFVGNEIISPKANKISELGLGWTAIECVDMAIWAYVNSSTFDDLLRLSIAHDGDSDSVAAVAGSLWGLSGKQVPITYIEKLDALDAIMYVVNAIQC